LNSIRTLTLDGNAYFILLSLLILDLPKDAANSLPKGQSLSPDDAAISSAYAEVEPLADFDWEATEPIQLRPFKPTYHLTMALQSCTLSDLVAVDNTYLDRIKDRRDLISTRCEDIIGCNPVAKEAVDELYIWIFSIYLPKRFPTMFSLVPSEESYSIFLLNHITNENIELAPPDNPIEALKTLGRHIDNEFLVLLPSSSPKPPKSPSKIFPTLTPQEPYHLHAFTLCYPSGFNTVFKLGLPLSAIHAPVPGYESKIGKSMDRFFALIPFGKIVKRANWAVQTDQKLFHRDSNHISLSSGGEKMAGSSYEASEEELEEWGKEGEAVKAEECRLRCERQTLHRLEKTGALVFGFKTYLYPLEKIREEGGGEEMAVAVEGLWKGSVPGMAVYKRGVVWGGKVCEFLRAG
jgi:hypothetical protein